MASAPSERLERLTFEFENGKTVILEREALAEWETTFQQGLAALALVKRLAEAQQAQSAPPQRGWGRPAAPPAPPSGVTVEGEPLVTLKQTIENKGSDDK